MFWAIDFLSCTSLIRQSVELSIKEAPYRNNGVDQGRIEQLARRARGPFTELLLKVERMQMSDDAGHRHSAVAPWLSKDKIKLVVLDVFISSDRALVVHQQ